MRKIVIASSIKVTFKNQKRERGLGAIGSPIPSVDILFNKKLVGVICAPNWRTSDNTWTVGITVKKEHPDNNPNCDWKWVYFKQKFEDLEQAKKFIIYNANQLTLHYNIHELEVY